MAGSPQSLHGINNYVSGNGICYIYERPNPFVEPLITDWVDLGDCPQFEFTPKLTMKDYWDHRTGVRTRAKRVKVKTEGLLKVTLTEWLQQNLTTYLAGTLENDGTTTFMTAGTHEFMLWFHQVTVSGPAYDWYFYRAMITPAEAINLIADGEAEGDWAKFAFEVTMLDDSVEHDTPWGHMIIAPTE